MKSKISFFNSVIYGKNLKLFWPIWLVYLALLAAWMPCRIALEFWQAKDNMILYGYDAQQEFLRTINNSLDMYNHIFAIAIVSIVVAIAMFHYLLTSRSANMFHAFPVNRTELYGTGVFTGLSFIWIPQIVTFVISLLICISYGSTNVKYLGLWLVMMMGLSFFEYSIAIVSVMCTGQMLGAPFIFALFNFAYYILRLAVANSIEFFSFGINNISDMEYGNLNWLSPLTYMLTTVSFDYKYDDVTSQIKGLTYSGTGAAIGFFVAGFVFMLIGLAMYRKRNIEVAGDLAAFHVFKPIFRWGAGIIGGLLLSVFLKSIMESVGRNFYDCYFFICTIVFGAIIFFLMDMLVQKSFRIISRRRLKEFGVFFATVFVVCGLIDMAGAYYENMVPESDDIYRAFVHYDYPVEVAPEEFDTIIAIQNEIINDEDSIKRDKSTYKTNVSFKYYLKNGETIERTYAIPITDKTIDKIYGPLYALEKNNKSLSDYLIGYGTSEFYKNPLSCFLTVTDELSGKTENVKIPEDKLGIIFEGIRKEIETGNMTDIYCVDPERFSLMKYKDGTYIVQNQMNNSYSFYISMEFECTDIYNYKDTAMEMDDINWMERYEKNPTGFATYGINTSYSENDMVKEFYFTEFSDCIIDALIESGVVSDIEELKRIPNGED